MELKELQVYKLTQKGKELVYRGDANIASCIHLNKTYDDYYKTNYYNFLIISKNKHPNGTHFYHTEIVRMSEKDISRAVEFATKDEDGYELLKVDTYDYSPFKREDVVGLLRSENEFLRQVVSNFSKNK